MTNEEKEALRVALGWRAPLNYETDEYAKTDEQIEDAYTNDGWVLEDWDDRKEAWQFDPNDPAISEPMFLNWLGPLMCAKMTVFNSKTIIVVNRMTGDLVCAAQGKTPSEARWRAIVAASEKAERSNVRQ